MIRLLKQLRKSPEDTHRHREIARRLFTRKKTPFNFLLTRFPQLFGMHVGMAAPAPHKPHEATRKQWANYVGTQTTQPLGISLPTSLEELQSVLQDAAQLGVPARAVGSGHAWSDAALTGGIVIETRAMARQLPFDPHLLRNPGEAGTLVHVEAGIVLHDLNLLLDSQGLALINMGGFDGQTIAGALSTSSHGSGLALGAYPSFIEAMTVVKADGTVLQIEKPGGISDPARFAEQFGDRRQLCQDARLFNACVVGIGCLGVLYSLVLRVTPKYWLHEVRNVLPWSDVRSKLLDGAVLRQHRHVEVWINPYPVEGRQNCLLTLRDMTPEPPISQPKPWRDLYSGFLAGLPGADRVLGFLFNEFPAMSPSLVEQALTDLEDTAGHTDLSYRMLNVGGANKFAAVSSEFAVDLEHHVAAADALIEAAAEAATAGVYQCGPIAMRYVAATPGFLSMHRQASCTFEFPMLRDVFGVTEILWRYEKLLVSRFGARPHWGQLNFLTDNAGMVRQLYPELDQWLSVFAEFNGEQRFYNRFTDRIGFSSHAPGR